MQKTWVGSLGQKDPLEEGMTTHSSILFLAEALGQRNLVGYSPLGSQRVRHDWSNWAQPGWHLQSQSCPQPLGIERSWRLNWLPWTNDLVVHAHETKSPWKPKRRGCRELPVGERMEDLREQPIQRAWELCAPWWFPRRAGWCVRKSTPPPHTPIRIGSRNPKVPLFFGN